MPARYNPENDASRDWDDLERAVVSATPCKSCWISCGAIMHLFAFVVSIITLIFHFAVERQNNSQVLQETVYILALCLYFVALIMSSCTYCSPARCCLTTNFFLSILLTIFSSGLIYIATFAMAPYETNYTYCNRYVFRRPGSLRSKPENEDQCLGYWNSRTAAITGMTSAVLDLLGSIYNMFCAAVALKIQHDLLPVLADNVALTTSNNNGRCDEDGGEQRELSENIRRPRVVRFRDAAHDTQHTLRILDHSPTRASADGENMYRCNGDRCPAASCGQSPVSRSVNSEPPSYDDVVPTPPPTYSDALLIASRVRTTVV